LNWRGDQWNQTVGNAIDRRLNAHRVRLAELLDIDLTDAEGIGATVDNLVPAIRYRIDIALEEIAGELRRCWSLLRDVNRAASAAQLHHTLRALRADLDQAVDMIDRLDPETRGTIDDFYPGGWLAIETSVPDKDQLAAAIDKALDATPAPSVGRPTGTRDEAGQRLAIELAQIYQSYKEERPTRRNPRETGGEEYGPYKDFVEEVMSIVPRLLRQTSKGGFKSVDHMVRIGVAYMNEGHSPN